jgi:hypothetical protein
MQQDVTEVKYFKYQHITWHFENTKGFTNGAHNFYF